VTTSEHTEAETEPLSRHGDPCPDCGAPMAADQRYCLSCGARRGGPRVPFAPAARVALQPADRVPGGPGREWTPLAAIGLVAVIALILVAGVLIGRGGDSGKSQIVRIGGSGTTGGQATAGGTAKTAAFTSDWPSGKEGYTVELGVLKKDGTTPDQVSAAKDDASGKGAKKVGALDSDDYKSLPGGQYVIFSGVYGSKAAASKALGGLRGQFPHAKVVKVGSSAGGGQAASSGTGGKGEAKVSKQQLQQLNSLSGDAYVKKSKKLPDTTGVAGKPPPKDNGTPGGGSQAVEIK
jgi:hypothetical protein